MLENFFIFGIGGLEDEGLDGLPMQRPPYAKLQSWKVALFQMLNEGRNSAMPARTPFSDQPNAPARKIEVIVDDQNLSAGILKMPEHFHNGFAAQVHEGLGFEKQDVVPFDPRDTPKGSKPPSPPFHTSFPGQQVDHMKPHIVAGQLILLPGIAQPCHDSDALLAIGLTTH
jgi:hypothetical protein